jgi:hypothetical protein
MLYRNGVHVHPKTVYRVMKKEGLLQSSKRYDAKRTLRNGYRIQSGLAYRSDENLD